jgi:glutamine synthetase
LGFKIGASLRQAKADLRLRYPDGARTNGALVMCEVLMPDGVTPHASNKRATILDDSGAFPWQDSVARLKASRWAKVPTAHSTVIR